MESSGQWYQHSDIIDWEESSPTLQMTVSTDIAQLVPGKFPRTSFHPASPSGGSYPLPVTKAAISSLWGPTSALKRSTRRYFPLRGPTSIFCRGFFGQQKKTYAVLGNFRPFLVFSSNLGNFKP